MSRILFGNIPLWGHINPTVAVVQQLMDMGCDVGYACHPDVKDALAKANIDLLEDFEWGDIISYSSKIVAQKNDIDITWSLIREKKVSPLLVFLNRLEAGVNDFLKLFDTWRPDVCVFDPLFSPGAIAAEIRKIPYVSSWTSMASPLANKELIPAFPTYECKMEWRLKLKFYIGALYSKYNIRYLNRIRQKYGLPPKRRFFDTYSPYLFLVYRTMALEHGRRDLPSQMYYIGPSISKKRGDTDIEFPWEWLDGTPTVYFSMGTIFTKKRTVDAAIAASKGAPWKLVVSVGENLKLEQWPELPENVLLRNYVPQPQLLEKVDAFISHGGQNSTSESLSAGVPLAIIPQEMDQFDSARNVVNAGAGIRLFPNQISVQGFRDAISKLLNNTSYRQHAQRIAQEYSQCDAPKTAAELIVKLALTREPLLRPEHMGPTLYADNIQQVLTLFDK